MSSGTISLCMLRVRAINEQLEAVRQGRLELFTAPRFTEEQLLAIDRAYEAAKSSGALAERDYRLALELQIDRPDELARAMGLI